MLARVRRQAQRRHIEEFEKVFERGAAMKQWRIRHVRLARVHEQIEQDENRRRLRRQFADAAFSRMQPRLQVVEGMSISKRDGQLSVEHEIALRKLRQSRNYFREI